MAGKKFSRLTALERENKRRGVGDRWHFQCDCGKRIIRSAHVVRAGGIQSCGCLRAEQLASENPKRHGFGWCYDTDGYVRLYIPKDQRGGLSVAKSGYIQEHRFLIERALGRPLHRGETVHHKNGIKDDNRPENLELRAGNHGYGQAVEDLVAWAVETLRKYSPELLK